MATKLPSGKYRTQVFIGYEDGKRRYKSFIAKTAKKADIMALEWQAAHPSDTVADHTLSGAMSGYINSRRAVLSPSTIRGYGSIRREIEKDFPKLCKMRIDMITAQNLQEWITDMIYSGASSKTCKNKYGFLSAVWKSCGLHIPEVKLPAKIKPRFNIPDVKTLHKLYEASKDTELEVPILLASIGPMRRGEIVGASIDDLEGNVLHVHRCAVLGEHFKQIVKEYPKTFESTRDIILPDYVVKRIHEQGYICKLSLNGITYHFSKLLEQCGIQHFRFHDLRHAFVSICHAAGVPDAYIQQRGGWATNYTMNNVYRHTLGEVQKQENEKINGMFEKMI